MVLSIKTNIFYDDNNTKLSYISLLVSIVLNKLENFQLPLNKFIMTNVHAQIAAQTTTVLFLSQVVRLFPAGCQNTARTDTLCADNSNLYLALSYMLDVTKKTHNFFCQNETFKVFESKKIFKLSIKTTILFSTFDGFVNKNQYILR